MVLMVMIALAMLSLSAIELRSSRQGKAMQEARANARMALMLAVGELQKQTGADRRVTARAAILGENMAQPHVLGVWDSWGAGLEDNDHLTDGNVSATYGVGREPRFRKWLIPGQDADDFQFPKTGASSDSVELVGEGSLGTGAAAVDRVSMPRIAVNYQGKRTGSYSWWISGENSKARVNLYKEAPDTLAAQSLESVSAPTLAVGQIEGLETLVTDATVLRGITHGSLELMGKDGGRLPEAAKSRFHDITVDSAGLLTNTKWGGTRKDLNLMMELDSLPLDLAKEEIYSGGPVWDDLRGYYRSYKPVADGGFVKWIGGVPHFSAGDTWSDVVAQKNWRRHLPIPTKWQWLISHYSVPVPGANGTTNYRVRMVFDNIMEMWNPYNLPMTMPQDSHVDFKLWNIPYGVTYYLNGQRWQHTPSKKALWWVIQDMPQSTHWQLHNAILRFQQPLLPGEVRVYSDNSPSPQPPNREFELKPGWEMSGGLYAETLGHGGRRLEVPGGTEIEAVIEIDGSAPAWAGLDHFTDIYFVGPNGYPNEYGQFKAVSTKDSFATVTNNLERTQDANFTAGSIVGVGNKRPLALMGMRMRTEHRIEPSAASPISKSELALTKSYLFTDPWQGTSKVESNNQTTLRHGNYEFFIQRVNSLNDYPFVELTADNKGYSGTSRGAREPYNGQSHVPVHEIPFQPLTSMGQLQHASLGHPVPDPNHVQNPNNPDGGVPYVSYPYVANAFGNSWALPFIESSKIAQSATAPHNGHEMELHDKSWKSNEALWDDWCFSSVTPQDTEWVSSGDRRSMLVVLSEAVSGEAPLPNSRYRFYQQKHGDDAIKFVDNLMGADGYKKIAAQLVCDGAFNINSTSVVAWKAFLASLDGRALAWLSAETGQFEQKDAQRYPVSRFTIPNADGAETDEFQSNQREFLRKRWEGVRSLTSDEIEELAEAVVDEVRERGPFLSLSEFVNRRLTSDDNGLKGALQDAIDHTGINDSFKNTSEVITEADVASASYKNSKAATGLTGEGAPGFVTQADILMSLAPLIRVRSDTFRIRAYGESVNAKGVVLARAYCEAMVQRSPEYVDSSDLPEQEVWSAAKENQLSVTNQTFGRRYRIMSFRWLSQQEI